MASCGTLTVVSGDGGGGQPPVDAGDPLPLMVAVGALGTGVGIVVTGRMAR